MGFFALAAALASVFVGAAVQSGQAGPSASEADDIISKLAAKESEFAQARENYIYRQSVRVQELTEDGKVGGEYELISDIVFTPDGRRQEYVVQGPINSLQRISLDAGDQQDLRNIQPFVLTTDEVHKYQVDYLGRETLDVSCYVFSVKPRNLEIGQRYFQGQIWVDERDLQIVKSYGRGVGLKKNGFDTQYPKFETQRKRVDGKYWFPVSTTADDTLNFQAGPQRMRMTVKYEEYKQFKSTVTITFQ
jgi:outer membrane lipoprotein-sorting protein